MRRIMPLALCLALAALLTGCSSTGEVENQAYALVLGVERAGGGGIALTIRIPRIGKSGPDAQEAGSEPYLVIAAEGDSYPQALERLQWAAARELNLSHLKLIIVSGALAASEDFPGLIRQIAETRHLFTTAGFIVCEGSARDFIEGQETILGTRMSSEITAMFRHYASHGYISRSTFADLYYDTLSGLGDPTGIWGFMDAGEQAQSDAEATAIIGNDGDALNRATLTASSRQYLGAAVFRDGRMVLRLDAGETLCLNLLTAKLDSFTWESGETRHTFSCARRPGRRVTLRGDAVSLEATVCLTCEDPASREALDAVAQDMSEALRAMVRRCQRANVEPFGFTERAAAHFLTLGDWRRFDWRGRYPDAVATVNVRISGA